MQKETLNINLLLNERPCFVQERHQFVGRLVLHIDKAIQ